MESSATLVHLDRCRTQLELAAGTVRSMRSFPLMVLLATCARQAQSHPLIEMRVRHVGLELSLRMERAVLLARLDTSRRLCERNANRALAATAIVAQFA